MKGVCLLRTCVRNYSLCFIITFPSFLSYFWVVGGGREPFLLWRIAVGVGEWSHVKLLLLLTLENGPFTTEVIEYVSHSSQTLFCS